MTLNGTVWAPVGPSPIAEGSSADNGMVTAIAVSPDNPNIIYIGTTAGGVWRSGDNGANWTPLFDRQIAIGIGEPGGVAIDPNNTDIIYAGTSQRNLLGDANPTFFNAPDPAPGLFKSIDGGSSWIQLGSGFPASNVGNALATFLNNDINVVIVDPADSNTVYCAASNGVWVSNNGGQNWTLGVNSGGDVRSLVLDPTSPPGARILYAGIVSSESRGAAGRGAFTSTDGGVTWTPILTGSTTPVGLPSGFSKVIVALAPPTSTPNPRGIQVIYVTAEGTGGSDPVGLFLSTNQGATWTQRTATNMPTNTQQGYSFHMAVDPASPGDGANDIIYFGTVSQARSTDSGNSFTPLSGIHADTHAWAFAPQPSPTPTTVFVGTDGGINQSTNNGTTWPSLNNGTLQTGLFYNIDVKPDAAASVIVGAVQDNEVETTQGAATSLGWVGANGGDGWDVAYDGKIPKQVYCSSGFWSNPSTPVPCTEVFVSTDDGQTYANSGSGGITPWTTATDGGCYLAPIATDPSHGGVVYVSGSQNLWQSQSSGAPGTWRIIGSFTGAGAVDVAAANGNNVVIAVGAQVFVSTNALATTGVSFTNITRDLPGRTVTRAAFDPADPTVIYAVLGGYGGGFGGHVFRTTVGGSAWTDITPTVGAPKVPLDIPFNAIAMDGTVTPTTLFVGTDFGVLRSMDAGASWSILDDLHFPRVEVSDLVFNPVAGALVAATYGRGVFKFGAPTGPAIAVELQDNLAFGTVCGGPQYLTITVDNVGVTNLVVTNVQVLFGSSDFAVLPTPATPITVVPGDEVTFTVSFTPSTPGTSETAIIRISSNDPTAPFVDVAATGAMGTAQVVTAIADGGDFGNACLGSFVDELLTINNSGTCPLLIFDITASPGFLAPSVLSYPLLVDSGDSIDVVVRFQPTVHGPSLPGAITIVSNDPASPHVVPVRGAAPAPKANLIIANAGDFGEVRLGKFTDRDLVINNLGPCPLHVTGIVSSAPVVFVTPSVVGFPLTVDGGDSIAVPIRFQPTNRGSAAAMLTISSNDPSSPAVVPVSGTAWPPLPIAGSPIEGYRLSNDSQHVNYIGTDKHVHELYITAGAAWVDNDLTEEAGAVPPTATSALEGYRLSDDSQHVFFIGTDNHVYELYITAGAGWIYNDLTALARAVPPNPTSALDGYRLSDDSKHVFFIGTDNHVHELQIARGGRWADNDLTTLAGPGTVLPNPTSALDGFRLGDDSEHVNFIGTDGHVHELTHTGAGWVDHDLTTLAGAGAVLPTPGSALDGFRLSDDSEHVIFIGIDGHVHELTHTGAGWVDNNLTTLAGAGAVLPTAGSALDGFRLSDDSEHVFFIGTDSHVHELTHTGAGWVDNDLTTLAGAVLPIPATALDGYRLSNDSKHVNFIGTDNHVHELYFTAAAGWVDNDLTALT